MKTILVVGASQGIGLELCRQFSSRGDRVIATCRRRTPALDALALEVIDGVEVADDAGIAALVSALGARPLDVLVHVAGILTREGLDTLDVDRIRAQFEVNALAPLRVVQALLPCLRAGSKVAILTSRMGSIADNGSGGYYGYRMSKAAVNAAGVSLARDLQPRGIAVFLLHPGMVATGMTGGRGIPVEEAAANLLARIDNQDIGQTGTFHHANGEVLPW